MLSSPIKKTVFLSFLRLFDNSKSTFGISSEKNEYPYKFGGLPVIQYHSSKKAIQFQHNMFSPEINDVFIKLYKNYLSALESKDQKYLKQNVQASLIEGIQDFNVRLVNKDSPIQVGVDQNNVIGDIGFDRISHGEEMRKKKSPSGYQQSLNLYQGYSLNQDKDYDLINLFSTKIFFKSAIKLEKSSSQLTSKSTFTSTPNKSSTPEVHLVQFQVEHKSSRNKLVLRKIISKIINFKNKQKQRQNMIRTLIGATPFSLWRIADVDRIKKGNLPKLVDEFTKNKTAIK